ncbi:hypothetical protein [Kitasatospora sp. NPDC088783]|uniref:hypothetical protein n=1 Tax=Kitasatospora sp. NPDC088783 TaxID=3364077 RepID=UPI00380BFD22
MLTSRQSAQLDWVRLAATGACMKRYGQQFPVPARPANWDTAGSTYDMMPRRYGVADPEQAHKFGYHLPYESDSASAAPSPQAINQLPEDARVVLLGLDPKTGERVTELHGKQLPEQGCLGEFDRLLPGADGGPMGPGSGGEGIVTQIKAKSWSDAKADQRVVAAAAAWSTCMARHGYSFTDPMEAPANLPSMSESTASPDEIHQADADVACKAEANITGIWFATETDLQNKAINANAEALQKVKATLEAESAELQKLVSRDWTTTA